jgi:hypothetical protein
MALLPCRECGHQVSTEAPICPQCGAKDPTGEDKVAQPPAKPKSGGCATVIMAIMLMAFFVAVVREKSSNTNNGSATNNQAEKTCKTEWRLCKDNGDLAGNWSGWSKVVILCKEAANDAASYKEPEWPWVSFQRYRKGYDYVKNGIALAIENDARFSNAFGTFTKVIVICSYDLKNDKVIDVRVTQK